MAKSDYYKALHKSVKHVILFAQKKGLCWKRINIVNEH